MSDLLCPNTSDCYSYSIRTYLDASVSININMCRYNIGRGSMLYFYITVTVFYRQLLIVSLKMIPGSVTRYRLLYGVIFYQTESNQLFR